jgi:hypothetical protein
MSRPQRDLGGPPRAADRRQDEPIASGVAAGGGVAEEEAPPAPWHFKVLLFATAGYLVYRLIWFIFWLTGHAWHG